ncbi:3'(2'),5'-bisphosphate nucleotidase CysQ [Natronospira bacteriovora]|uniref:3'(2'),5'-bisphosphate nucleotidase CysQ n=1 Tax=Natronospira bacteriovora TaxID=3069753 RepID=A0ABU0W6M8_9GAMM|nr:3'(2'),5'-bisphosphate nucleotidase CysQ [Natronospira sp. AB-CW4]MDQ2069661.1 3'(2'),5'-bisphosphate nucleotidase CysQ [Natronospira sp. AB-CW4]
MNNDFLEPLTAIARDAGKAILAVYDTDFDVEQKDDDSPVTRADMAAHRLIVERLAELTPGLPILSEEAADIDWEERRRWQSYWLVDPLDGTKEFVKRNGEFTVNIALINDGVAQVGVVHVPVTGVTYLGCLGVGAYRQEGDGDPQPIQTTRPPAQPMRLMSSRSHGSDAVGNMARRIGDCDIVTAGSSLKFCRIAEGEADIYPRFGPTSEWDTAAAQAVLEAAGGCVIDLEGKPFRYNRKAELLNGHFIAAGDPAVNWIGYLD